MQQSYFIVAYVEHSQIGESIESARLYGRYITIAYVYFGQFKSETPRVEHFTAETSVECFVRRRRRRQRRWENEATTIREQIDGQL